LLLKKKKVQQGVGYSSLRDDVMVGEVEGYSTCSQWGEGTGWRDAEFGRPALQGAPIAEQLPHFLNIRQSKQSAVLHTNGINNARILPVAGQSRHSLLLWKQKFY